MDDIYKELFGFIKHWETLCNEDGSGEYIRRFKHLVFYWRVANATLKEPIELFVALKDKFWPSTQVSPIEGDELDDHGEVHEEFAKDDTLVGTLHNRPLPSFQVACDLYEGYFISI